MIVSEEKFEHGEDAVASEHVPAAAAAAVVAKPQEEIKAQAEPAAEPAAARQQPQRMSAVSLPSVLLSCPRCSPSL